MESSLPHRVPRLSVLVPVVLASILVRMFFSTLGKNDDMLIWEQIAHVMQTTGLIYLDATKHCYGPIWSRCLLAFAEAARVLGNPELFRYLVSLFLSLFDIGIAYVLFREYGKKAALVFLFHPITVFITGYHGQFDNMGMLFGFMAILIYKDGYQKPSRKLLGLFVLGISLIAKHILFVFPLWIAVREEKWKDRVLAVLVPVGMFLASFIPFWHEQKEGIIKHVLLYRSWNNAPLWNLIAPKWLDLLPSAFVFFVLTLAVSGVVFRHKKLLESALLYCSLVLMFGVSVANQHLVLAVPYMAIHFNPLFFLYSGICTIWLMMSQHGLNLQFLRNAIPLEWAAFHVQAVVFFLGYLWIYIQNSKPFREIDSERRSHSFAASPPK